MMFFVIMMLWQVYYHYVPLFLDTLLTNRYGKGDYENIIGHIMSLDNLAAILIIPLFSFLSDRTRTRMGRRIPYMVWGSIASLILFPLIAAMYILNQFVWYFVVVALLVFSMATFRSPAVAIAPDITPKPLRASASAIMNFVGYIGGMLGAGIILIVGFLPSNDNNLTIIPFMLTSVITMVIVLSYLLKFNENKTVEATKDQLAEGEHQCQMIQTREAGKKMSRRDKVNFAIIIMAVFFCWFAFNALQNFGSLYARKVLDAENLWQFCAMALAGASLATFLPSIWLSKKIGRKWSCIIGLSIVVVVLVFGALFVSNFGVLIVALFAISGVGWALVMVNSYPMLVEMATVKNVGLVTGIYYFVSQGAMFITSNVSGYVYRWLGLDKFYFWYAVIFMSLALFVCFFFKQKPKEKTIPELLECAEPTENIGNEVENESAV